MKQEWGFKENHELHAAAAYTIRNILQSIKANVDEAKNLKELIHLGHGDPSAYPCFQTCTIVEDALVESIRSAKFNCYPPGVGIEPARRSIAEHLSRDLPYKLTPDDIFLTAGANHGIEVILTVLARPGANILFPRPNYPIYEARASFSTLEVRHYDLLPEKGWDVDLDGVKALANSNTVAIVLINPGNPCGNVFTFDHMKKVAETARELGIMVIADEVYAHQVFGEKAFIPMGIAGSLTSCLTITADPPTVIQGAVSRIIENTPDSFFMNINKLLGEASDILYKNLKEIPHVDCPHKPEGSMFAMVAETARELGIMVIADEVYAHQVFGEKAFIPMGIAGSLTSCLTIAADPPTVIQVKLNLSDLDDIIDDADFCMKLAKEESVIVFPGTLEKGYLREMIGDYKHATDDLQILVSILETGENSQGLKGKKKKGPWTFTSFCNFCMTRLKV
nr:tyrosine/nicotianamine aminotransferase, pyridoxal phosphate-dependent transferase [Tanacetum cinerariifolium]